MNNFIVSEARMNDLHSLKELAIQTFTDTYMKYNKKSDMESYIKKNFNSEQLKSEIESTESMYFIIKVLDTPAAYIKLNQYSAQTEQLFYDSLEIERIYVLPKHKGCGLGRLMINKAIEIAKKEKKESLWLGVWEKNLNAILFYEKLGFKKHSTHKFLLGLDRQTDIIMTIQIQE